MKPLTETGKHRSNAFGIKTQIQRAVGFSYDRRRRNARPVVFLCPDQCYFLFISDQNKNDIPFSVSDQTSSVSFKQRDEKVKTGCYYWLHNNMI